MEEKNIYTIVEDIAKVVQNLEQRVGKHEQLILKTFTYLYNRQFDIEENLTSQVKSSIDSSNEFQLTYLSQITKLNNDIIDCKNKITTISQELENNEINKHAQILTKKTKRKRPWYWIFIKNREYKKLLIKKKELENEIQIRIEEKRRQKELEEQKRQEEIRLKREAENKAKAERNRRSRQQMNNILKTINNKQ